MKRKTSLAMGGKAIPFALSLLTANLLVANTALAQDDNKNLEEVVITGSYIKGSGTDEATPVDVLDSCLLYTSPSPRDPSISRMPSSA